MVTNPESPQLLAVLREAARLSQTERLQLIVYLTQQAHQEDSQSAPIAMTWQQLAGIAPNLLGGQDAQEWVSGLRATEWERDLN
jgi:hypothetical protein